MLEKKTIEKAKKICSGLMLMVMILAPIPHISAKIEYSSVLQKVYKINLCTTCHVNPEGDKPLTDYGSKFKAQPNYKSNPEAALRAIGEPSGITIIETAIPTQTVTLPSVTRAKDKEAYIEDKGDDKDKKDAPKETPGFDIVVVIGIISAIYMSKKIVMR